MKLPLISVKNARMRFYSNKEYINVLGNEDKGLDFTLEKGQHTAILGPNGAGKSTFLRILRGEEWLKSGDIQWLIDGKLENTQLAGRTITSLISAKQQENYMRQAWDIIGEELLYTGFANTLLQYTDLTDKQKERAKNLSEELNISHLLQEKIVTYSQGQLRIMLLARALLSSPKVVLLDEYTDGLDEKNRELVLSVLEKMISHTTFVMSTHRTETLPPWVNRTLYLKKGELHDNFLSEYEISNRQLPTAEKIALEVNKNNANIAHRPLLVELTNADIYVESNKILQAMNWEWKQGETWFIHGANGAGKSTFLRLLTGDEYPALGGTIKRFLPSYGGFVHTMKQVRKSVRLVSDKLQACYTYDVNGLDLVLSGFDNSIGIYREFTQEEQEEAMYWIKYMQMEQHIKRSVFTLSTGQFRKLLLARALVGSPDMLLLDEPYSGLDPSARRNFIETLIKLREKGIHLLIVSHHESDSYICNRVARIENSCLIVEK